MIAAALSHDLSPGWQAFIYVVALIVFVVAAFKSWAPKLKASIELVAVGLALVTFVAAWNAIAAT